MLSLGRAMAVPFLGRAQASRVQGGRALARFSCNENTSCYRLSLPHTARAIPQPHISSVGLLPCPATIKMVMRDNQDGKVVAGLVA